MSTHVIGFIPPDKKWKKMKAAYDSCHELGIRPPNEVVEFFRDEEPDPRGLEVEIDEATIIWNDDGRQGFEVEVDKLPADVKIIRFYNSW